MLDPKPAPSPLSVNEAAAYAFDALWHQGYDGLDLARAFVRIAAETARGESALPAFREDAVRILDELGAANAGGTGDATP
jgi:hypothetical protein